MIYLLLVITLSILNKILFFCMFLFTTGAKNGHKRKWKKSEIQAVERHLLYFINQHKVPQKYDCIVCLEAEPEALRNRSWKGLKDYVRNRITALKNANRGRSDNSEAHLQPQHWGGSTESEATQSHSKQTQYYFLATCTFKEIYFGDMFAL